MISPDAALIGQYAQDGAVFLKGLFAPFVEQLRAGVARNMAEPGPCAAENLKPGDTGRFFDDYCNWSRIPEFAAVVMDPGIARVAAALMVCGAPRSHLAAVSGSRHGERAASAGGLVSRGP